jgi:cytochrome c556
MFRYLAISTAALIALFATAAIAQHNPQMMHQGHMAMSMPDGREAVHFPPEMQAHMLRNMRDHMQTLDGIVQALAESDYAAAARLASERLGLDSPSAASCKPKAAGETATPAPGSMDEMMAKFMPEPMRNAGLSMHTAASEFARTAATRDNAATMAALAKITQSCVACHSAYRLR